MKRSRQLARLIHVLHDGEALAAQTTARQSGLAGQPWMRHAFAAQCRQERAHRALADSVAMLIGATKTGDPDLFRPLRLQLERDLDAGRLAASVIGFHGMVEHLGETLLDALGRHPCPVALPLHALRRAVLAQEHGHVLLGARCLRGLRGDATPIDPETMAAYRETGRVLTQRIVDLLDDARLDATLFWSKVETRLDAWTSGLESPRS